MPVVKFFSLNKKIRSKLWRIFSHIFKRLLETNALQMYQFCCVHKIPPHLLLGQQLHLLPLNLSLSQLVSDLLWQKFSRTGNLSFFLLCHSEVERCGLLPQFKLSWTFYFFYLFQPERWSHNCQEGNMNIVFICHVYYYAHP